MANDLLEYWSLVFLTTSGTRVEIFGACDILRLARDEWVDARTTVDGTGNKVITVHGFTDSADRAELQVDIDPAEFIVASLCRMT